MTAAERRAAEVRATRGPRVEREPRVVEPFEPDQWIDEGSVRDAAQAAAERATSSMSRQGRRISQELAPEVEDAVERAVAGPRRDRYRQRLAAAADALDRGRYDDARRMVQPVLRDLPDVAFAHELAGLALYRLGQWRKATAELEIAHRLDGSIHHLPVLADCARATRDHARVETLWAELREASPAPELLAEGRIVAAGALADQGDLAGALRLMQRSAGSVKRVREHHLRQWYVIADLYDRSGDVIKARQMFSRILEHDPDFADAPDRLRALGR